MKSVPLSTRNCRNKGRYEALVDDTDFAKVSKINWSVFKSKGGKIYASGWTGERMIMMHRFILDLWNSKPYVDHWNGNGLDNSRRNLRIATQSQNIANSKISSRNKTGYKGVSFLSSRKKFRAYLVTDRKYKHLGYFSTAEEAARAYDREAKRTFGEFANINF